MSARKSPEDKICKRLGILSATLGLVLLPVPAMAQSDVENTNPSWLSLPSADEMSRAYPGFASGVGIAGAAQMRCTAQADGTLADCSVHTFRPTGLGFDRAALSLMPLFRMSPKVVDGVATDSRVTFTVTFTPEPTRPSPPWTGREVSAEEVTTLRPIAKSLIEAEWAAEDLAQDVDADRADTVTLIQSEARAEFMDSIIDGLAVSLARILTPEQIRAVQQEGELPYNMATPQKLSWAASGAYLNATRKYTQQVRDRYCALYDCSLEPDLGLLNGLRMPPRPER